MKVTQIDTKRHDRQTNMTDGRTDMTDRRTDTHRHDKQTDMTGRRTNMTNRPTAETEQKRGSGAQLTTTINSRNSGERGC